MIASFQGARAWRPAGEASRPLPDGEAGIPASVGVGTGKLS
jgi:hypothetical protein